MSPKDRGKEPPTTNFNERRAVNSSFVRNQSRRKSLLTSGSCSRYCSRYCSGEKTAKDPSQTGRNGATSYVLIDITNPADLIKTGRVSIGRPNKDWLSLKGVIRRKHV
jgi:hypothetical protein